MGLLNKKNIGSLEKNIYHSFISGTMVLDDDIMERWVEEESEKISAEINKQLLDILKEMGAEAINKTSIFYPEQPWGNLSYLDFPQIYPIVPEHIQKE